MDELEYFLSAYDEVDNPAYKFYILFDGRKRSLYLDFVDNLEQKSDIDEYNEILALMDRVRTNNLTKKQYRHITKNGKKYRKDIWEFKSKHLRVYVAKGDSDYYVILAGYKKTQDFDIDKVFKKFNKLRFDELPVQDLPEVRDDTDEDTLIAENN